MGELGPMVERGGVPGSRQGDDSRPSAPIRPVHGLGVMSMGDDTWWGVRGGTTVISDCDAELC